MLTIMLQAANGAATQGAGGLMSFLPFILIIVVLWVLMIVPQRKRQKETKKMLEELKPKDKVVTIGGIIAEIANVKKDTIVLKIGKETKIEVRRSAISQKVSDEPAEKEEKK